MAKNQMKSSIRVLKRYHMIEPSWYRSDEIADTTATGERVVRPLVKWQPDNEVGLDFF